MFGLILQVVVLGVLGGLLAVSTKVPALKALVWLAIIIVGVPVLIVLSYKTVRWTSATVAPSVSEDDQIWQEIRTASLNGDPYAEELTQSVHHEIRTGWQYDSARATATAFEQYKGSKEILGRIKTWELREIVIDNAQARSYDDPSKQVMFPLGTVVRLHLQGDPKLAQGEAVVTFDDQRYIVEYFAVSKQSLDVVAPAWVRVQPVRPGGYAAWLCELSPGQVTPPLDEIKTLNGSYVIDTSEDPTLFKWRVNNGQWGPLPSDKASGPNLSGSPVVQFALSDIVYSAEPGKTKQRVQFELVRN